MWRNALFQESGGEKHYRITLKIAVDMVELTHKHHNSVFHIPSYRHAYTVYIHGALVALAGVILLPTDPSPLQTQAIRAFEKGIALLKLIAPGVKSTRRALSSLSKITAAVERTPSSTSDRLSQLSSSEEQFSSSMLETTKSLGSDTLDFNVGLDSMSGLEPVEFNLTDFILPNDIFPEID